MLNGLDLFSGIGGITLALKDWVCPVAYCEIDPYCQGVLLSRGATGELPEVPIWDDIKTLDGRQFIGAVDIVYGGFPCQGISIAGHGKGLEDERSGLFFEVLRLAKEIKPKFIFLENVPAITSRGGLRVVKEIASLGYDCRWCVISAASVGALHRRERWFLLAHASSQSTDGHPFREEEAHPLSRKCCDDVSDSRRLSQRSTEEPEWTYDQSTGCYRLWETEPPVGRVADGVQNRVDKLRALGNAVVPQQVKEAFKILMGINNEPNN